MAGIPSFLIDPITINSVKELAERFPKNSQPEYFATYKDENGEIRIGSFRACVSKDDLKYCPPFFIFLTLKQSLETDFSF
jgi:hypothetical protein